MLIDYIVAEMVKTVTTEVVLFLSQPTVEAVMKEPLPCEAHLLEYTTRYGVRLKVMHVSNGKLHRSSMATSRGRNLGALGGWSFSRLSQPQRS